MLGAKKCRFLLELKNLIGRELESPRNEFYILRGVSFDSRVIERPLLNRKRLFLFSQDKMIDSRTR